MYLTRMRIGKGQFVVKKKAAVLEFSTAAKVSPIWLMGKRSNRMIL
ncbi:hypothetical protein [Paenibacillus glycanilyticus]|uniref:Uncharacterized protein n=1 Tax=Paenibacillus glycanilyticus TaxID=126569 RepID=A0ABQ6G9R2_9BACL|nr:hypothetical protein [Paenibacillus glycanilyticus]GLX66422.1 hypothetical protein MU1_07660 [Paenibacillus glycanilyticus]